MKRSIFEPPEGVDTVVEIDTSDDGAPAIDAIAAAVVALLGPPRTGGRLVTDRASKRVIRPRLISDDPGRRPGR